MWDLKACRSCLSTEGKLEKVSDTLRRLYGSVTGLEFKQGDGYPNYFCLECYAHMKKCLAFRRKSRRAHFALQGIMKIKKQITVNDILKINRSENNLNNALGACVADRHHCYSFQFVDPDDPDSAVPVLSMSVKDFYNQFQNQKKMAADKPIKTENLIKTEDRADDLKLYRPNNDGNSYHLVEITSTDIPDYVSEPCADSSEMNVEALDETLNIDMDDVFKDLHEEPMDDDDVDLGTPAPPSPAPVTESVKARRRREAASKAEKRAVRDQDTLKRKEMREKARLLTKCDLVMQNIDEMKANIEKRSQVEAYAKATLKCVICVTAYDTLEQLVQHVKFHNRPGSKISCSVCPMRLTNEEELQEHEVYTHHFVYNCKSCDEVLYTYKDFKRHFEQSHKNDKKPSKRPSIEKLKEFFDVQPATVTEMYDSLKNFKIHKADFKCRQCNLGFKGVYSLLRHEQNHKMPTPPTFMCDICKTWRPTLDALTSHINQFHKYKYKCYECDAVVFTKSEAVHHNHKHKYNSKQFKDAVKCTHCEKTFKNIGGLKLHQLSAHYSEMFCHHCVACGSSFSSSYSINLHQIVTHGRIIVPSQLVGEVQFSCLHCDIKFMSDDAYKVHLVKHNHPEAKDIPFACATCKRIYADENEFELHSRNCKGQRVYPRKCVYCPQIINSVGENLSHYGKKHPGLSYHRLGSDSTKCTLCELCGKSVKHSLLPQHMRLHRARVSLECGKCGLQAPTPVAYTYHVLKMHARRPYRCALCPAVYKYRAEARDHILKVHAPVRPYSCKWCPLKFSHVDYMNEHTTKIHDAEPVKIAAVKSKGRIYTYPHLQVDFSEVGKEVMDALTLEVMDYHDQNPIVLKNPGKFFLLNPPPVDIVFDQPGHKRPRKNKAKTEKAEDKNVIQVPKVEVEQSETENQSMKCEEMEESETVIVPDYDVEESVEVDPEAKYEVIETEEGQFVMLNGVLYKIEDEQ